MNAEYLKFVQWSDEDKVYVGYCPDLFMGGICHGKDERKVYAELCKLVEGEIKDLRKQRRPLPKHKAMVAMAVAV